MQWNVVEASTARRPLGSFQVSGLFASLLTSEQVRLRCLFIVFLLGRPRSITEVSEAFRVCPVVFVVLTGDAPRSIALSGATRSVALKGAIRSVALIGVARSVALIGVARSVALNGDAMRVGCRDRKSVV